MMIYYYYYYIIIIIIIIINLGAPVLEAAWAPEPGYARWQR
jgi:hypothetical protein